MSGDPSEPSKFGYKPRFRIQQAILILREGKSHPAWREAAWHLMEHAGKDTQLLLEAQRELLLAAQPKPSFLQQYGAFLVLSILGISCLSFAFWVYINKLYCG
ncbi:hypothetical protein NBRC116188_24690 [Oceaniserpentilla sp. 4NH20-0058]|uniref:hypothetical protein n=1 Tax=Oceaniserpentilla sp. 4NH20-0058 TaxID=3127660 RepID=UPI00310B3F40